MPRKSRNRRPTRRNNRRQSNRRQRRPPPIPNALVPSDCLKDWILAVTDPRELFHKTTGDFCIPDDIVLPSYKVKVHYRGTFAAGTNGVGFVLGAPRNPASATCLYYTDSTYAGTTATTFNTGTGVNAASIPSNFVATSTAGAKARCVGFGIYARYTGRADARAGSYILCRHPTNLGLFTGEGSPQSPDSLLSAFPVSHREVVGYQDVKICFRPATDTDTSYQLAATDHPLALCVTGAVAGASFDFSIFGFWEEVGGNVSSLTLSKSDSHFPEASYAVQAADSEHSGTTMEVLYEYAKALAQNMPGIAQGTSVVFASYLNMLMNRQRAQQMGLTGGAGGGRLPW